MVTKIKMKKNLIDEIKKVVKEVVYSDEQLKVNFSDHLAEKLNYNYTYLSNRFMEIEGHPLKTYFIQCRIERAKILIEAGITATNASKILSYSSLPFLSHQFKTVTGINIKDFQKQIKTLN